MDDISWCYFILAVKSSPEKIKACAEPCTEGEYCFCFKEDNKIKFEK